MEDQNALPPSKKRVASTQISKDNPELDEDTPEQELGTFKRASDEVLASRKIVKVRKHNTSSTASAPSANPFAGIRLVPPSVAAVAPSIATNVPAAKEDGDAEVDQRVEEKKESDNYVEPNVGDPEKKGNEVTVESAEDAGNGSDSNGAAAVGDSSTKKEVPKHVAADEVGKPGETNTGNVNESEGEIADNERESLEVKAENEQESEGVKAEGDEANNGNSVSPNEAAPLKSFQQLSSSRNAFTGLAGTGFSSSPFSFGSSPKDGSPSGSGFLFGSNTNFSSIPSFSFGNSTSRTGSPFGSTVAPSGSVAESSGFPAMKVIPVETGEENEETVFSANAALFEFLGGGWKERGKGEVKVNVSTSGEKERARLVMRTRGNLRLILNASLYPDMKLADMDKKGTSFACLNATAEKNDGLSTYALKFKDSSVKESFSSAVAAHKGEAAQAVKTDENSVKASDV